MDISSTLEPNSDQLDAVELLGGPRIFTIESVSRGSEEQPVNVHLVDFPRPWRPGKSMRRVLASCWGVDASAWVGRRVELYFDPDVTFGKETPGGTRIARLSHIDKQQKIPLLVSRGKSATFTVEPLPQTADSAAGPLPLRMQLTHMSAQEKADLWKLAGLAAGTKMADVKARLIAYADELGLEHTEEPDARHILDEARARVAKTGDAAAFQHMLDTDEDLDPGDQASLDALKNAPVSANGAMDEDIPF